MTCYNPIPACYSKSLYAKTGKKELHSVMHELEKGDSKWLLNEKYYPHSLYEYIYIPCRKCAGCRSDNAKMWSLRAYNEMQLHKENCFITLTYDNNSPLVQDDPICLASLRYRHFQNFIKRLRKRFNNAKLQYLVCGEYGLKDGRSHWHCILFGFDFKDKELVYVSKGYNHYYSQDLQDLWSTYNRDTGQYIPIGFIDLCNCDIDCCNYVSQYVMKKLDVDQHHVVVDHYRNEYGEDIPLVLEDVREPMIRSSRNPSIGLNWYKKYGKQAVENGFIYNVDKKHKTARKIKTPEYYFKKYEEQFPEQFENIKKRKEEKMRQYYKDNPVNYDKLNTWKESHLYRIKKAIKDKLTRFVK